jgi:hypothetical protein
MFHGHDKQDQIIKQFMINKQLEQEGINKDQQLNYQHVNHHQIFINIQIRMIENVTHVDNQDI